MNINKDKFLCILGKSIYSINYVLLYENITKGLTSFTGDSCQMIFEKNGIPSNFQQIFIKLSSLSKIFMGKTKGSEYLTNIPIEIFKNNYNDYTINGEMFGKYPGCRFNNASYCSEKDILEFISNIREAGLLENYLQSLGEIFQINIKTNNEIFGKKK